MQVVFNKYTVDPLYPWVRICGFNQAWIENSTYFQFAVRSLPMRRTDYALFYTILYKRLEHPFWCPGTNTPQIPEG